MQNKYKDNNDKILSKLEKLSSTYMLFDDAFYNGFVYAVNYFTLNKVDFSDLSLNELELLLNNNDIYTNGEILYSIEFTEGVKSTYGTVYELCYPNNRSALL